MMPKKLLKLTNYYGKMRPNIFAIKYSKCYSLLFLTQLHFRFALQIYTSSIYNLLK